MTPRTMTAAIAMAATLSTALAGSNRAPRIEATVDASGRVTPASQATTSPDRIDEASPATPCASGPSLAPEDARALVQKIAAQENFYPDFVLSVAKSESGFNSSALSYKGAYGLMQLTPETAARFKVDLCDPAGNVLGGVRFLRALHEKYRNPFFILAAYNAGEAVVEKTRGVPPYPETVRFVAAVINDFYTWPTPGRPGGDRARGAEPSAPSAPMASDLVETSSSAKPAPVATSPAPRSAGWDSGFVMHID